MNLCIDIGNTRTKAALFDADNIVGYYNYELNELMANEEIMCSVNNIIISSTRSIVQDVEYPEHIQTCIILDHETPIPIQNEYLTPKTLGRDRLASSVGAYSIYPDNINMVIDAGTCITFDIVDHNKYLGGNISPGIRMRSRAMHIFTGMLPEVEIEYNEDIIGRNTETALQNGAVIGTILEIDSFIESIKAKFDQKDLNVILTGGDADFLAIHLKSKIFVRKNIVLIGLHEILKYNAN